VALIGSASYPICEPFAGGLEAHVWQLAQALKARGHEVALFAAPGSDPVLTRRNLCVQPLRLSASARRDVSMTSDAWLQEHHAYLSLMLWLQGPGAADFDVIHNHSLHHLPVAMAPALSTPMVSTLHTPPTPWLESAVKAADPTGIRFVAVSKFTARAWTAIPGQVGVIPNGVDTTQWKSGPGSTELIWFGRIVEEKGPDLAIAAARMAGCRLNIAGPVADGAYFARKIAPRLDEDIVYMGHLRHRELRELVGRSGATLVTPCWDEPYGLVVAESLACGTPVVAFARGGIPEVVTTDCGVLVAGHDTNAMADGIAAALLLSRSAARARAVSHCSVDVMVDAYCELYRELAGVAA
jgi:glycosyltransferase involved in cell wall biosynthesis